MNQASKMNKPICEGSNVMYNTPEFNKEFPGGVSSPQSMNSDSAIQSRVHNLQDQKKIPGILADLNAQVSADKEFYNSVQAEYCWYEKRYVAALTQFFTVISTPGAGDGKESLNKSIEMNNRLKLLLKIIYYIGNDRAQRVNNRNNDIAKANVQVEKRLNALRSQQEYITSSDVRIKTQEEMMRFSKEKNSSMNIQIMFFVTLNVVALGTVFMVYKNVKQGSAT